MSIVGERINPGVYNIENFVSKNFVNVEGLSTELVCRPGNKGQVRSYPYLSCSSMVDYCYPQWQIIPDGPGYSISLVRNFVALYFDCNALDNATIAQTKHGLRVSQCALEAG